MPKEICPKGITGVELRPLNAKGDLPNKWTEVPPEETSGEFPNTEEPTSYNCQIKSTPRRGVNSLRIRK